MEKMLAAVALIPLLAGCGTGTWTLYTWGEEYIEDEIPADVFADGCSLAYDEFLIAINDPNLVDGDNQAVSELPASQVFDMTQAGPHEVGSSEVRATTYDRVRVRVSLTSDATVAGNASDDQAARMDGLSLSVAGTLTCGVDSATFAWAFQTETMYLCEPELTIGSGGAGETEFTVHGDHLFYDGLENPDALVRGQPILDADGDGNGEVTREEMAGVDLAPLGLYDVGSQSDVATLDGFVQYLTRTLGHVDGEGHCQIEI